MSDVPGGATDLEGVRAAITGHDMLVQRDPVISDLYSCQFADRLLALSGDQRCHHAQFRRFSLRNTPLLQLACYPEPPSSNGLRLWCDPAIVWIFVGSEDHGALDELLAALQPHWERLLAHHGVPLDRALDADLAWRYPVPNRPDPLSDAEVVELRTSVEHLITQEPVKTLINETLSPREAVDATLQARRVLTRHMDRLDLVLEHSHGAAREKFQEMDSYCRTLAGPDGLFYGHLLAPHRHLVDGFEETRLHVQRALVAATETTSLITSAAVGRLLDRSDANRRTTTAIGAAAFLLALVGNFSALAAIPRDDRALRSFVQLGAWVSFGALALIAGSYGLARLSAVPSHRLPRRLRSSLRVLWPVTALAAAALLALAGITASVPVLVVGVILAVSVAVFRGAIGDY